MIEIKLNINPCNPDKEGLRQTARYLLSLCGDELVAEHQMLPKPPTNPIAEHAHFVSKVPLAPSIPPVPIAKEVHALTVDELPDEGGHGAPITPVEGPVICDSNLDSKGLPWDNRIHSRTRSKTGNGNWKLMRGVSAELVAQVEQELQRTMNAPIAPLAQIIPNVPSIPFVPNVIPEPTETETNNNSKFFEIMAKITMVVQDKLMTHSEVITIVRSFQIESVPLIAQRPDLIPSISAAIDSYIHSKNN